MSFPGFKAGKPLKEGSYLFYVNLLTFLPKKVRLVSFKIYGKKELPLQKKVQIPKKNLWKVIAQVVLVSMNKAIYFSAPLMGYFAHMDLKKKWNVFKINAN